MGSGAGSGGGIYGPAGSTGTLALVDCEVLNNNSSGGGCGGGGEGGGLITGGSNLVLLRCTFRGNASSGSGCTGTAGASGGGAHLHAVNSLIMNCTFELNRASGGGYGFGGGLMTTGTTSLANCLLKANDTSCTLNCPGTQSSGIYNWGSSSLLTLRNCTIVSNTLAGLPPGAAGGVYNSSNAPPVQIHNCIVYGNEAQQLTSTTVAQYSLIQGGYAGIGNISGDPLFVNAAGGDYGLQDGSPCRDTGNRSLLPSDAQDLDGDGNTTESLSRDLDMLRRIVNDQVDMGAYEWQRTCLTDISPSAPGMAGDGNTNIGDLLAVIAGWGPCDQCNADVNNDDVVNIADLLAVIAGWGPCP
jgi:hypothetical protein